MLSSLDNDGVPITIPVQEEAIDFRLKFISSEKILKAVEQGFRSRTQHIGQRHTLHACPRVKIYLCVFWYRPADEVMQSIKIQQFSDCFHLLQMIIFGVLAVMIQQEETPYPHPDLA